MATLKIVRGSDFGDFLRAYVVVIDGEKIGKIRRGQTKEFPISSGPHELALRIDWCGSRTIRFSIDEAEMLTFFAKSGRCGRRGEDPFGIIEGDSWICLSEEP